MNKEIQYVSPFKKLCITVGNLPTAYIESMSYYEGLTFLVNYLSNNVIPAVNNNSEVVKELQDQIVILKNYVDNYFDNLDVQEEINTKLDEMSKDGSLYNIIKLYTDPIINEFEDNIQSQINNQNANISTLDTKITQVASGSPLVANSTDDMTDTSRVYVNTTDGKWYYYDGDSWEIGGTYQSTGIENKSISPIKTTFYDMIQILPDTGWEDEHVYNASNGNYISFATGSCCTEKIPVTAGEKLIVYDYSGLINIRILYWKSDDTYLSYDTSLGTNKLTVLTVPENASYMRYMYYNGNTSVKPASGNIYRFNDYFKNANNKNAVIKDEYFNNLNTNDILISNKIKLIDKVYSIYNNTSARNINIYNNKVSVTGTLTPSVNTRYMGICFKLQNIKVGDILIFNSNINKNVTIYPWNITQDSPITTSNYGQLSLASNTSVTYTVTQSLVDYLNNNDNNVLCLAFGTLSTESELDFYVEIKEPFGNTLYDYISRNITNNELNIITLGDSITALTGDRSWLTYFNQILPINIIQNVAVSGAWLMDKEGTIYDGNPVFNGPDNNINNVLGNQVQKILNNNYSAPDLILIAIGTNGGINCTEQEIYNSYYDNSGNLIPLENVDRKTSAGAFRYCNETLRTKYPNATIFWCSPIQAHNSIRNLNTIINYSKNLKNLCEYSSTQFIDTQDCGITGYTENNGSNGLYLADGLHPNSNGAKYMGYYNATKVKEYTEGCKLLND